MKYLIIVFVFIVFACTESNQRIAPEIKIGNKYEGGIVFYLFKETDKFYVENETHGLIVKDTVFASIWGCQSAPENQMSYIIGEGDINTSLIINYCGLNNAAGKCEKWYLPNSEESKLIVNYLNSGYYWTSSKASYTEAYVIDKNGNTKKESIFNSYNVIPIKRF